MIFLTIHVHTYISRVINLNVESMKTYLDLNLHIDDMSRTRRYDLRNI